MLRNKIEIWAAKKLVRLLCYDIRLMFSVFSENVSSENVILKLTETAKICDILLKWDNNLSYHYCIYLAAVEGEKINDLA